MDNSKWLPFSIREGYINANDILSKNYKGMTEELKTSLWNKIYNLFHKYFSMINEFQTYENIFYKEFAFKIWEEAIKKDIQKLKLNSSSLGGISLEALLMNFKKEYNALEWFRIYDVIECITKNLQISLKLTHVRSSLFDEWINDVNNVLEREFAPYRLLKEKEGIVVPITNEKEIETVEQALYQSKLKFTPVYEHLKKSIQHLSNREKPDYENAIKEAVSAIESLANLILGESSTLTALLQKLSSKLNVPKFIELQIKELYNWSSREPIRHGTGESPNKIGQEEARFVIIEVSALINYLISKLAKRSGGLT